MQKPTAYEIKFACLMAFITAGIITFTLVSVNFGYQSHFVFLWFRSWLIAFIIAVLSILFIGPAVRKFLMSGNAEDRQSK